VDRVPCFGLYIFVVDFLFYLACVVFLAGNRSVARLYMRIYTRLAGVIRSMPVACWLVRACSPQTLVKLYNELVHDTKAPSQVKMFLDHHGDPGVKHTELPNITTAGVHASLDTWPWFQQVTPHSGSACGKGVGEAHGPGIDEMRSSPSDEETGDPRQRGRRHGRQDA
jgi:hypothetical protein